MTTIELLRTDAAWTWFHDPRAVYTDGKTHFSWGDASGIWAGTFDHETKATAAALLRSGSRNDHDVAAFGVRSDGRLIAMYSRHNDTDMYYRISTNPGDATAWGAQQGLGVSVATYPMLAHLSEQGGPLGRWIASYRTWPNGQPGTRNIQWSDDDGETWSASTELIRQEDHRPYMKMWSDGADTMHFIVTDGHPSSYPTNSVYHFQYVGGQWQDSTGADLGDPPFNPAADLTRIYNGATNRGWVWDVCADPATGHPVATFQARHSPLDIRYHYARWDGSQWNDHEVVSGGRTIYTNTGAEDDYGGGIMLNHDDPSIVYLSREVGPTHELERWHTDDGGQTWTSEPITSDSGAGNKQFRPFYMTAGPHEVIWCGGSYDTWTSYSSNIYGLTRESTATDRRRAASVVGLI